MALILEGLQFVKETTETEGDLTPGSPAPSLTLDGAVDGFESLISKVGNGNDAFFTLRHNLAWMRFRGTVTTPDQLSIDEVLGSSDNGNPLVLGPGTKQVYVSFDEHVVDAMLTASGVVVPAGHLWGLTLSNNSTDATNDIDVTIGACASDDTDDADRVLLNPGAMTKRLDATWAAGTNQGGRASSQSIANGTWHVFAIRVGGVDDYGFDTSITAANLIADHAATHVRRIGSILRESAAIVGFVQDGDYFRRKASVLDVNTTNPGTSAVTATLSVPTGLSELWALFNVSLAKSADYVFYASDLASTDVAPSSTAAPLGTSASIIGAAGAITIAAHAPVRVNGSAQIRYRLSASDGSTIVRIATYGWIDNRGRLR